MIYKRKRIVVALGGNALGNTLPEQMIAVKSTAKALCDLIEEGHQVVVVHGNGPQVGMINNAMTALTHEDQAQPNTPLSVCVAMSQAYIGYDLQNALREELRKRGFMRTPVVTVVTQVRVDPEDPAFENPSKPIGKFLTKEEADFQAKAYGHVMKEDAGRGYRRVVASPKPAEIIEIGAIRSLVDSGQLVIACGGGVIKSPANTRALRQNGPVLWVRRPLEALATGGRPLSKGGAALKQLEAERTPLYEAASTVVLENNGSLTAAVDKAVQLFEADERL